MSHRPARSDRYDVVVVGGGHNGLVAAAYLARAGVSVLVLERLGRTGGAAVTGTPFEGRPTRVSPYASVVSMLPEQLMADLGLDVTLRSPRTATYAPTLRDGKPGGLLVERVERDATRASFAELTGSEAEYDAWRQFGADAAALARAVAPTLLGPLPTDREVRDLVDPDVWRDFVLAPIGDTIVRRFTDDTVRGVVATGALTGTFSSLHDAALAPNRDLLYRLLGPARGEWRVPVGGIGAVTDALGRAAVAAGAEIVTGAGVSAVRADGGAAEVTWASAEGEHTVGARFVLSGVAPWVLRILTGEPEDPTTKPEGAQLVVHLLLDRLPRLRSGVDPELAFAGTVHVGTGYRALEDAHAEAAAGRLPTSLPGLVSCPSLTDPTVLGDAPPGTHTLSFLGLHAPASLFEADPDGVRQTAVARAMASLDQHLVEPLADCVARDSAGRPCVEALIPQDVERDLAMPGGHAFHGDLDWPWAPARARLDTPAQQWGVQTHLDAVLLCGSGARRGGGVSGLGGHHAAHAVLASR